MSAEWWDGQNRLKKQNTTWLKTPLFAKLKLNRSQFVQLLKKSSRFDPKQFASSYVYTSEANIDLQQRGPRILEIQNNIVALRSQFTLMETWEMDQPPPSFFTTTGSNTAIPVYTGKRQGNTAAKAQKTTQELVTTLQTTTAASMIAAITAARTTAKLKVQSQPILMRDQEVFDLAVHLLQGEHINAVLPSLRGFVQGLAQRFNGVYERHVDLLKELYLASVKVSIAKEAHAKSQQQLESVVFTPDPSNETLIEDLLQDMARSVKDAVATVMVQMSSSPHQIIEAKKQIVLQFATEDEEMPTEPEGETKDQIHSPNLRRLATMRATTAHARSPPRTPNAHDRNEFDMFDSPTPSEVDSLTSNGLPISPSASIVGSPDLDEENEGSSNLDHLAQILGTRTLSQIIKLTKEGQQAAKGTLNVPLVQRLRQRLRAIAFAIVAKSLMSQRAISNILLPMFDALLHTASLAKLGKHPIGSHKEFSLWELPLVKRLLTGHIVLKNKATGKIGVFLDEGILMKEFCQLASTQRILNKKLLQKYADDNVAFDSDDEDDCPVIDMPHYDHTDATHLPHRGHGEIGHITTKWKHFALFDNSAASTDCLRCGMFNDNDGEPQMMFFGECKHLNTHDFVPFVVTIEKWQGPGKFFNKRVKMRNINRGNTNDGKNNRNAICMVDARDIHDLLNTGSMDRESRRKRNANGGAYWYPAYTFTATFFKFMIDNPNITYLNEDWCKRHGFKKKLATHFKRLPRAIRMGHDWSTLHQEIWHLVMRTAKNFAIDMFHLLCQRRNQAWGAKCLKIISLLSAARMGVGEKHGKFNLTCKKISYALALIVDMRHLIFSKDHGVEPDQMFSDPDKEKGIGALMFKMCELLEAIARACLGDEKEMKRRMPWVARNAYVFEGMHAQLFGANRIMPTETDWCNRVIFYLMNCVKYNTSTRNGSQEAAETDNFYIKQTWINSTSQGGGNHGGRSEEAASGTVLDGNGVPLTDADLLMSKSLLRTILAQLVPRMSFNENIEYGKAADQLEEQRQRSQELFEQRSTQAFPLTESARAPLKNLMPRPETKIGDTSLSMIDSEEDSDEEYDIPYSSSEDGHENSEEEEEEEENTAAAAAAAAAKVEDVDDGGVGVGAAAAAAVGGAAAAAVESETSLRERWRIQQAGSVLSQRNHAGYSSSLLHGGTQHDVLIAESLTAGAWKATSKEKSSFTWLGKQIDLVDPGTTIVADFRWGSKKINIDVTLPERKKDNDLKVRKIGGKLRSIHNTFTIDKCVVTFQGEEMILELFLDDPPELKAKDWTHTDRKSEGQFKEVNNFKWQDQAVANSAQPMTNPVQVVKLKFKKSTKSIVSKKEMGDLSQVLHRLQAWWRVPVHLVTPTTAPPEPPHSWDQQTALNRMVAMANKMPGASDDAAVFAEKKRLAWALWEWSEFGSKRNIDPSKELIHKCWSCGLTVFIPAKSVTCPVPAPSVQVNGSNVFHDECNHRDIRYQDTPCALAREGDLPERWPPFPTVDTGTKDDE